MVLLQRLNMSLILYCMTPYICTAINKAHTIFMVCHWPRIFIHTNNVWYTVDILSTYCCSNLLVKNSLEINVRFISNNPDSTMGVAKTWQIRSKKKKVRKLAIHQSRLKLEVNGVLPFGPRAPWSLLNNNKINIAILKIKKYRENLSHDDDQFAKYQF
jgi:hypothetical protein